MKLPLLLQLLDENRLAELFGQLQNAGVRDAQYARLRDEFTTGVYRTDVDYFRRLRVWLQTAFKNESMPTSAPDHGQHLKLLLAQGNLGQVIDELFRATDSNGQDDLHSEVILYSARYHSNEKGFNQGITSEANYKMEKARLNAALQDALSRYEPDGSFDFRPAGPAAAPTPAEAKPGVFISYSHQDSDLASKVRTYLEEAGYPVTIDTEAMKAGENIKAFIGESIRNNQLTLSLVTHESILSAWVAKETINSFSAEQFADKQFIAAYDDPVIFKRSFVEDAFDKIEAEINDIRETIQRRLNKGRGIEDLNDELSRYQDLAHNLPRIMQRIKGHRSVAIGGDDFAAGMEAIVEALN